ncbi:hypothetical protein AB1Y20_018456 [Prymnesium parvum]|uniref:MOSC domain-containing protein n=1 Tax=Prymnesium parvum TaxID=97485 RepID=A0AB34JPA2_PRYPA
MSVVRIQRFAVKGLSSDELDFAELHAGRGLPNDRRFAFIFLRCAHLLRENEWLHKENFLSVFATPSVCCGVETRFDDSSAELSVWRRGERAAPPLLVAPLGEAAGREAAAAFFSTLAGEPLALVDGADTHQFGNTRKGVLASGDLRTLHLVNENTVRALSEAAGVPLDPRRFRPNLLLRGVPAWEEFSWVGKELRLGPKARLRVISRTTRCAGVDRSAEAAAGGGEADAGGAVDVCQLLRQHFPQHGPFLGVYAQCCRSGGVRRGDALLVCAVSAPRRWAETAARLCVRLGVPQRWVGCRDPTAGAACAAALLLALCLHAILSLGATAAP